MSPIKDYETYCTGMSKSMRDKMFFLDKIDPSVDTIFDYGCADGALFREVEKRNKNYQFVGYDIDEKMLAKAPPGAIGSTNFGVCLNSLDPSNTVLVLSSVIHEIYSYANPDLFWKQVFSSGFKYISIRDMCISNETAHGLARQSDVVKIKGKSNRKRYNDFCKNWGSIFYKKNYLHYLLKYRYITNWDREVHENYLPITIDELKAKIPENYEISYENHYVLPFLKDRARSDFGVNVDDNTHVKLVLKKKY